MVKKIFKRIDKYIRIGINTLVRLLLGIIYFIFLFPFAVLIKLCTDFLEIKKESPDWAVHKKIENLKEFLTRQ